MVIDYKGDPIEVAFNPKYFIETLNVMEEDKIELNIVNDEKPCLIEGLKEKEYLSVIMPMKL
jgi:DNA polymerase-3 subunit beta